jgi:hypothetical protein
MSGRNDVPPKTVGVELREEGVAVEYLDGRVTLYRGVPERVSGTLTASPGKEVHVLVTDPTETEGVMLYVNDLKTEDEILESSGVGRVILREGESESLFPGVTVERLGGQRTAVEADPEVARGRVFVFMDDEWTEDSYEFVAEPDSADGDDDTETETDEEPAEPATDDGWIDDPVVGSDDE